MDFHCCVIFACLRAYNLLARARKNHRTVEIHPQRLARFWATVVTTVCHIFFSFRPLCFISPFPRFISSPRAAPAKVASLLISPSAQSAMSPRSQGGCNCELQKKWQMISSKTVVQQTRTESGRLTLKSVRLPEVRTWYVKRMKLRLPMPSCYLDIARLWCYNTLWRWRTVLVQVYLTFWLSGRERLRKILAHVCRKGKTFFIFQKCFHKLPFKEHRFSSFFVI